MMNSMSLNLRRPLVTAFLVSGLIHYLFFSVFSLTFPNDSLGKNNFEITFWGSILDPYDVLKSNFNTSDQLKIPNLIQSERNSERVKAFSHQTKPDFGKQTRTRRKTYLRIPIENALTVPHKINSTKNDSMIKTSGPPIYEHLRLDP